MRADVPGAASHEDGRWGCSDEFMIVAPSDCSRSSVQAEGEVMPTFNALPSVSLLLRAALGGILMGLANLVPGISGGTMLLAAGVYPEFIESIAAITTLRRRLRPWVFVACVGVPAAAAIGLLAGTVRDSVLDHRWVAYSLFIGLTLGGVPMLWRMVRPLQGRSLVACAAALVVMGILIVGQESAPSGVSGGGGYFGLFVAAFVGSAAMVLPGVSGGYLLLLLGQYVAVLDAIAAFTDAVRAGDGAGIMTASTPIVVIGVGLVLGIVVVSNSIRWLLARFPKEVLGALLGLLIGAVLGLWPFRVAEPPAPGSWYRGALIESTAAAMDIPKRHWPMKAFTPTPGQVIGSIGLVMVGFSLCWSIGRLGAGPKKQSDNRASASNPSA